MDQTKIDDLLKLLARSIHAVNSGNDISLYYLRLAKWMEDNAPEYLQK